MFPHHSTALVVGASRGIGAAITQQLLSSLQVGHSIAASRQLPQINNPRLAHLMFNVSQRQDRQALKKELVARPILRVRFVIFGYSQFTPHAKKIPQRISPGGFGV